MQHNRLLSGVVGLFVVLALAATVFLAMRATNMGGFKADETYRLYALFNDISGLNRNASVTYAGVQIGQVTKISLDPKSMKARVDMTIDQRYQDFDETTSADILTAGLLGEKYIGLTGGGGAFTLADGDQIPLTSSSMVIERLVQQFVTDMSTSSSQ
ncbi:outer membrane lipid asymmetry maintenance protein MlaD [Suttonella sp. R2A3]|uniref:outer membrane lipid asymmetry maintenance protein MlaD n=1 Tax=Suttonella sp. R2A3 TaxID=2908648 RepID=UPI001F42CAC9|nr:outer membrane lipid asymmetry maintenance protein MlaD [Suttonella sp. R2A3]UJF24555.1 outer membrane lipid asymmetry maintenance protein MlaD [Suttonella sp. R2A3]